MGRTVGWGCAPLSPPECRGVCATPVPAAPPQAGVHLLWRCPRRSARWYPLRSAPSGTGLEGTGLTCARGPWSGPCTLARGAGEGSCIPRGCRSEGERTGPKRKAEPLCQGQLLLPDYPVESQRWGEGEKSVSGYQADPFPGARGHPVKGPALCLEPAMEASLILTRPSEEVVPLIYSDPVVQTQKAKLREGGSLSPMSSTGQPQTARGPVPLDWTLLAEHPYFIPVWRHCEHVIDSGDSRAPI